jgi:hypothetical protein
MRVAAAIRIIGSMQLVHAPTTHPPFPRSAQTVLVAAIAVLGGLVVGIGTQELQGVLPGSWGVIANSGVAWALCAFAIGTLMPSDPAAIVGGATAMVLASVSYYWAADRFEGVSSNGRSALIWSVAGLVAGPAFGVAGRWVRSRRDMRWLALAPVAGVLIAEGGHLLWFVGVDDLWPAGVVELTLGAVLTAACVLHDRRPLLVLGVIGAAVAVHHLAYDLIGAGFQLT